MAVRRGRRRRERCQPSRSPRETSRETALAPKPAAWQTRDMGPALKDAPLVASPETAEEIREDEASALIDVSAEDLRRWAETGEWPESFA